MIYAQPGVRIMKDGREICLTKTKAGRDEYRRRKRVMFDRQNGFCGLCAERMHLGDTENPPTFEHQDTRGIGGSLRDDRIYKEVNGKLVPYNMCVHLKCNQAKGSKKITSFGRKLHENFARHISAGDDCQCGDHQTD